MPAGMWRQVGLGTQNLLEVADIRFQPSYKHTYDQVLDALQDVAPRNPDNF